MDDLFEHESKLHLEKKDDPDYMGYITFDAPGQSFSYTADGSLELESEEVHEVIEKISDYRDSPKGWSI